MSEKATLICPNCGKAYPANSFREVKTNWDTQFLNGRQGKELWCSECIKEDTITCPCCKKVFQKPMPGEVFSEIHWQVMVDGEPQIWCNDCMAYTERNADGQAVPSSSRVRARLFKRKKTG